MQNLHRRFDWHYIGQIYGGDFAKFCGLLRIYELYWLPCCKDFVKIFQRIMRLAKFVKCLFKEVRWLLMEVIKPNKIFYEHISKVRRSCNSQQGSTYHVRYSFQLYLNFILILFRCKPKIIIRMLSRFIISQDLGKVRIKLL